MQQYRSLSALLRSVTYARRGKQKSFEFLRFFLFQRFFLVLNACFTDIQAIKNVYLIAEFFFFENKRSRISVHIIFLKNGRAMSRRSSQTNSLVFKRAANPFA